jgi:hypothetical protein
MQKIQEHC